ncbi:hypothetical protein [Rummeliibacillus stabekisii]|uniref:hypothetical protein n=1 Tax=Rummeliibacillus stabekisii TaxID=241244 RepID=UPI001172CEFF|nr:hypothetical protein [Rummeliibacillus stabekisii]MBB5170191.1 hypothetical protein [Rummeliibacillus stabekisii]GEL04449.1 hypothetical protein RST01_10760 [Rummeliibacillus stabekisii]
MNEKVNSPLVNQKGTGSAPSFSSPTSPVSEEETRILAEYISQQNMFQITNIHEPIRKTLTLKKFFKMKRNQEVVITISEEEPVVEGKVATIGRDFVMITNLKKRIWLPYSSIVSATIPFGHPTYSNAHQNYIYDNGLREKLILKFGETVTKRDALVQQFFEESLRTNLDTWKGCSVEVRTDDKMYYGKINRTDKSHLYLKLLKAESVIPLNDIHSVATVRLFTFWREMIKAIF